MRLLGVDWGSRRIGFAVGELEAGIATPRTPLPASGSLQTDASRIAAMAEVEEVQRIVIGVPLQPDPDGDPRQQRLCRTLAAKLTAQGLDVAIIDESLTSVEAENNLRTSGEGAALRRRRRDGEAACLILERYFAESDHEGKR